MTRENEIAIASCAYGSKGSSFDFEAGARWADNNPKSPWISIEDDLPCDHEELLDSSKRMTFQVFVRYDDGKYGFSCMAKILDEWKWLNSWTKITHWMLIPPFAE